MRVFFTSQKKIRGIRIWIEWSGLVFIGVCTHEVNLTQLRKKTNFSGLHHWHRKKIRTGFNQHFRWKNANFVKRFNSQTSIIAESSQGQRESHIANEWMEGKEKSQTPTNGWSHLISFMRSRLPRHLHYPGRALLGCWNWKRPSANIKNFERNQFWICIWTVKINK